MFVCVGLLLSCTGNSLLKLLHWWQRWDRSGMTQEIHGLTLPEINADSREEFDRSWKRFEVIAAANKWEGGRDLVILPALLRGKLLDIYMQLPDSDKADLARRSQTEQA